MGKCIVRSVRSTLGAVGVSAVLAVVLSPVSAGSAANAAPAAAASGPSTNPSVAAGARSDHDKAGTARAVRIASHLRSGTRSAADEDGNPTFSVAALDGAAPDNGPAGTFLSITSVDPCPSAEDAGDSVSVTLTRYDPDGNEWTYQASVDGTGSWSVPSVVIRALSDSGEENGAAEAGSYYLDAFCQETDSDGDSWDLQDYDEAEFDAGSPLAFDGLPDTSEVGSDYVISAFDDCPSGSTYVSVDLYYFSDGEVINLASAGEATAADGSWGGLDLTVPGTLTRSALDEVRCWSNGHQTLFYDAYDLSIVGVYAALGDSYSSGEGAPPFLPGSATDNKLCHRSYGSYAEDAYATSVFPTYLEFVACSGAVTKNFYHGDGQRRDPGQADSLGPADSVVSFTIGGNDANFASVLKYCIKHIQCQNAKNKPERGAIKTTIGRLPKLYRTVLQDAPNAQVFVLGYPHFFSPSPSFSCNQIGRHEALWMTKMEDLLDAGIKKQVSSIGSDRLHFVDTATAFHGGEECAAKHPIYMNGVIARHPEYSFHPTLRGQAKLAARLEAAVGRTDFDD
jgi:hypothetical protein